MLNWQNKWSRDFCDCGDCSCSGPIRLWLVIVQKITHERRWPSFVHVFKRYILFMVH